MSYTANDIQTLDFREAIRTRIEMYMGSADNQGVIQNAREIISNCIDETTMGFGKEIIVELFEGNHLKITDEGRGCPFGIREDGTEALEAIFMTAHSGGKFSDKTYQSVIGMNGIGGKGVALSSSYFKVESMRDGQKATLILKNGIKESFTIEKIEKNLHGTIVEFIPAQEVYRLETIYIDFEDLKRMCRDWSYLNKGIKFILKNHITSETLQYFSKDGLLDLLKDTVKNPVHPNPIYIEGKTGDIHYEIALQWTKDHEKSFVFTNGLHNAEGGTSLTGLKTSITRNVNKLFKKEFSGEMARSGLVYAVSMKIPNPSFANQTKTKINNPELRSIADKAFADGIAVFKGKYPSDIEAIAEFLSKEEKAERAAQKARDAVINYTKEEQATRTKKVLMADKLKDAEFLGEDAILLIVEGDSAAATIAVGRDTAHYGILPIRGKMLNCLTHDLDECLENEEIKAIALSLGCGLMDKYNPKRLRYGKVAICVDADDDGAHIACLIMTMFLVLMPQFIFEHRLCWLKSPLFREIKGTQNYYYYTDDEYNKNKKGGTVSRFKGLGELSKADTEQSMFNKEKQRLEILIPTPEAITQLELLMGKEVKPRKDFVFKNIDFSKMEV